MREVAVYVSKPLGESELLSHDCYTRPIVTALRRLEQATHQLWQLTLAHANLLESNVKLSAR